jgi:ribosomal protein S18 acetylase RimI-like enzyme
VPDAARRAELWTSRVWPGAVVVGGEVAGTWRRAGALVTVQAFRELDPAERDAVAAEAESLPMFDHHLSTGAAGLPVIGRSQSWPRRRALYEQLLVSPEAFVVVARRGTSAVGYALAHVHLGADDTWNTGDRIGEVESLAVLPPERGCGLGTLLLDCAEAILESLGARDVMIGVVAGNDSAQRFYERRGMAPAIIKLLRVGQEPGS